MVLEQCCESWRTAKQTQSASIDASNSATAMPNPNFPSSNHRAQFIPARDSRNRAAITRSFGLTWVTGRKPRAHFRFGMVIINPCALHQPREALEIKRHERRQNHLPSPGRKPPFADYVAPYFEKAKVQRKRPGTVENECQATERWHDHLGHVRMDQMATPAEPAFRASAAVPCVLIKANSVQIVIGGRCY